jgi:phosphatidylserine decarboxylase
LPANSEDKTRETVSLDIPRSKGPLAIEPLDPQVRSIQPGGGACMRIELAWGRLRRCYLKAFRRGYLARMEATREGDTNRCPHEVLDPRDLKFYRNQGGYSWKPEHDPFVWRDHLPFVREGLAELELLFGLFAALAIGLGLVRWWLALGPAVVALLVVWFFRNPRRIGPEGAGLVVSPADGKVVAIEEVAFDEFVQGPAVVIGIFLSIFNVHINRMPVAGRVIGVRYRPGKFLNALLAASARENEQLALRIEESGPPHRRMIVRQIAGQFARRIVCFAAPGEEFSRAARFGMIKLGSRTELVLPREPGLAIRASIGDRVKAGTTILAQYDPVNGEATK